MIPKSWWLVSIKVYLSSSFHVRRSFDCGPAPCGLPLGSGLTAGPWLGVRQRIIRCNDVMASKDPTWKCCISLRLTNPNMAPLVDLHEPDRPPPFGVGTLMLGGQIWAVAGFHVFL